jgi:hypothetical protein
MTWEYTDTDFNNLNYGHYPEDFPQKELRSLFSRNASAALQSVGINLPQEKESEAIGLYRIASFQVDCLMTALMHSLKSSDEVSQTRVKNDVLSKIGYKNFIDSPIINDGKLAEITANNLVRNIDGTYTITAFLGGKILRQVITHPSMNVALLDCSFFYSKNHIIEVRNGTEANTITVYPKEAKLSFKINERDWLERQVLNLDSSWSVEKSFQVKVGELEIAGKRRSIMEYLSPVENSDTRSFDIFDLEKTRREGGIEFDIIDGKPRAFLELTTIMERAEQHEGEVSIRRSFLDIPSQWQDIQITVDALLNPSNIFDIRSAIVDFKYKKPKKLNYIGLTSNNKSFGIELNPQIGKITSILFDGQRFNTKDVPPMGTNVDGVNKIKLPNGLMIDFSINEMGMLDNVHVSGNKPQA